VTAFNCLPFLSPINVSAQPSIKHRYKANITATILEAVAAGGTTKAKIYYRSFLTYQRLKGYLLLSEENGLIEYNKEECLLLNYRNETTEKDAIHL
jgi:predicted transcriptional regulator